MMDKLPTQDPSIKLVPSKELRKFIGTIKLPASTPAAVRYIHTAFNISKGKNPSKSSSKKDAAESKVCSTVDFTVKESCMIKQFVTESKIVVEDLKTPDFGGSDQIQEHNVCLEETTGSRQKLSLNDIKWLYSTLVEMRQTDPTIPYLYTLLSKCQIELPENPIQERNPELEARCQRLRKEQEQREYHRMTKNVDSVRKHMPEETIAYQMKQINRHLIAVAQFVFSVAAGFAFGFIGIELIVGQLDFGFRLLLGIIIALVIALAEIYFLAKKLNEEYELPPPTALCSKQTASDVIKTERVKDTSGKEHKE